MTNYPLPSGPLTDWYLHLDDGLIDESDLREVMKACMLENGMEFDEKEVADLANALFEDAVRVSAILGFKIRQMIQQGQPFLLVIKFVLNNYRREIEPTNQIAFANFCSLIGRCLEERAGSVLVNCR